ncbi:hypothetical protein [Candidatus Cardinium hertigii]|uniref:hypothetical protein n=1 Tax=Candidatus Cardinium hertigii TaxID=247481 RepID=UPI003B96976E
MKKSIINETTYNITINVGTGIPTSGYQLINIFEKALKHKIEVISSPEKLRKIDVPFLYACNEKIKKVLKWNPTISLEKGIASLINNQNA